MRKFILIGFAGMFVGFFIGKFSVKEKPPFNFEQEISFSRLNAEQSLSVTLKPVRIMNHGKTWISKEGDSHDKAWRMNFAEGNIVVIGKEIK